MWQAYNLCMIKCGLIKGTGNTGKGNKTLHNLNEVYG